MVSSLIWNFERVKCIKPKVKFDMLGSFRSFEHIKKILRVINREILAMILKLIVGCWYSDSGHPFMAVV